MIQRIIFRLKNSQLFKDSFWAVFGNGLGNFLLLMAGILIARLLGKDIYGEYGMVKTTMFHIAAFSTFGLSYTTTKFIAEFKSKDPSCLRSITEASLSLSVVCSFVLSVLIFCFAEDLAQFINAPQLKPAFRFLSVITILRAISMTGAGLLAGYKSFKELGMNNIISGLVMVIAAVPLTYFYGLFGSLSALALSQLAFASLNLYQIRIKLKSLALQTKESFYRRLLTFSFPVAIQELSYTVSMWGSNLLIVKYASAGELGLYTASAQWYSIVLFLPSLLQNVVLSYLSGLVGSQTSHHYMLRRMLLINFVCALIPFLLVMACSSMIVSFYGSTFEGMQSVLVILIFATIPTTLSNVYVANFLAESRNWMLSILRVSRDIILLISLLLALTYTKGNHAALNCAIIHVGTAIFFLLALILSYMTKRKNQN